MDEEKIQSEKKRNRLCGGTEIVHHILGVSRDMIELELTVRKAVVPMGEYPGFSCPFIGSHPEGVRLRVFWRQFEGNFGPFHRTSMLLRDSVSADREPGLFWPSR